MKFIAIQLLGEEKIDDIEHVITETLKQHGLEETARSDDSDLIKLTYHETRKGMVRALLTKKPTFLLKVPIGTLRTHTIEDVHAFVGFYPQAAPLYEEVVRRLSDKISYKNPLLQTEIANIEWLLQNFTRYFESPETQPPFTRPPKELS
jgi:hypothetical protein